ncbi:MAG: MlaD family protein [Isosphaeraceae bacterium]|nr:MlaD family protein [Isosphaeraceae bacterium]
MGYSVSRSRAIMIGLFVAATLVVGGFAVVGISGRQFRWQPTFRIRADFPHIGGIAVGDRVRIQGIDAGVVESIIPPTEPGKLVGVQLRIDAKLRGLVRADAIASIQPTGIVGAKVVEIAPQRSDTPLLPDGGTLLAQSPRELGDLLADAKATLERVDAVATSAERGINEVIQVVGAIREGKGSLGKFVQDDEAYRALLMLSGRGNKTLTELEENLTALKHTWPLSSYFNDRSFFDREKVLFRPGANREGRNVSLARLFEPGRSVLTAAGRVELDSIAGWFQRALTNKSEIVIAVHSPGSEDAELALMLTQEQANAIRKYLIERHKVDSIGWFGSRKVAAVGFGTQPPRFGSNIKDSEAAGLAEIFLFTPQL